MKILAFDIGHTTGWAYKDEKGYESGIIKFDSCMQYYWSTCEKAELWKPAVVLVPVPTRFYTVISFHRELIGIIKLVCERKEIEFVEVVDNKCKKAILGNGRASKEDIMAHFKEENEHIADAKLFLAYYEQLTK